jgi:hypothetical protein
MTYFFASEREPDLAQLSFGEGIFTRDSAGDVIHDYDASNAKYSEIERAQAIKSLSLSLSLSHHSS